MNYIRAFKLVNPLKYQKLQGKMDYLPIFYFKF